MEFEWNPEKAAANLRKHGVHFGDAVALFHDDWAITVPDAGALEKRFVTVGSDTLGRILVAVYAWRGRRIRLISCRRATRRERSRYEDHR